MNQPVANFEGPPEADARGGSAFWPVLSYRSTGAVVAASDAAAVALGSLAAGAGYHSLTKGGWGDTDFYLGFGCVAAAMLVLLEKSRGAYAPAQVLTIGGQLRGLALHWLAVLALLITVGFVLRASTDLSRGMVLSLSVIGFAMVAGQRVLIAAWLRSALDGQLLKSRKIVVVASHPETLMGQTAQTLERQGFSISRVVALEGDGRSPVSCAAQVLGLVRSSDIEEIHLAVDWTRWPEIRELLVALRATPLPVRLMADATAREVMRHPAVRLDSGFAFELQRAPLTWPERIFKRALDIVVASIGLILCIPLFLIVAAAIRLDTPGPVLFRQHRNGFNGRPFEILKFRSMTVMENGAVVAQARRNDPRVTRVGRWLRGSSIDELPQLLNVLRGEMSVIGPRPHPVAHDRHYEDVIANYAHRHHVKPGITGWAQVRGFRGETPSVDLMERRIELDLWYIANWSAWLELRILAQTIVALLRPQNAY